MDKKTELAVQLYRLGVSRDGVIDLLSQYTEEEIQRQLDYLPFRKAKRKEAFIVEAIRKGYSPPKEFFYAQTQADLTPAFGAVDEGAELPLGSSDVGPQGHGTENPAYPDSQDFGLAASQPSNDPELPNFDGTIR